MEIKTVEGIKVEYGTLEAGDVLSWGEKIYIKTDFEKNGETYCIALSDGHHGYFSEYTKVIKREATLTIV